ncbi:hypothetical protein [Corynebacterium oculi]|uniref:ABC-2 family transporter protein n=1 Tax=Corynebacterium oculi TaxID=1544416 RepID=A0A0Q0UDF0_9CORY|nr:hypothetical protein [Corynebacterium oculi]KQB84529.1 ABC-2 family transporter protein [Corynebacterium oculi]
MAEQTTSPDSPEPTEEKGNRPALKLLGILLGVPCVLIVMLLAFLVPSLNSGASDLPLGVSGPAPAVEQVTEALDQRSPGAFDITTYDSADGAVDAVKNRDEIGAISLDANGITVVTASGAGTPYSQLLKQIGEGLEAQGNSVEYRDVAPFPEEDPTGSAIATLGLPVVFGGNVSAMLLIFLLKGYPRLSILGGILLSITGGISTAAVLQYGFHVLDGDFILTAAALSLGIAAICMTLQGLHNLAGMTGIGIAGILLLFLANPLAGLATGPDWLPAPWGEIGQLLPIGAAGTAIRSAAYFDGAGSGTAFLVLSCWTLAGFLMAAFVSRHKSRKEASVGA